MRSGWNLKKGLCCCRRKTACELVVDVSSRGGDGGGVSLLELIDDTNEGKAEDIDEGADVKVSVSTRDDRMDEIADSGEVGVSDDGGRTSSGRLGLGSMFSNAFKSAVAAATGSASWVAGSGLSVEYPITAPCSSMM